MFGKIRGKVLDNLNKAAKALEEKHFILHMNDEKMRGTKEELWNFLIKTGIITEEKETK